MQTEREPSGARILVSQRAFAIRTQGVLLALSFLWTMSALAITRIESVATGLAGSGDGPGSAVSLLGETMAVGALSSPLIGSASVDVYRRVGTTWQPEAVLQPADPVNGMQFGSQVAVGTDLLVTTSLGPPDGAPALCTFARTGNSWTQVDRFVAGGHLSRSGDTLAIGTGAIYVRAGSRWVLRAQLAADEGELIHSTFVGGDGALAWTSVQVSSFVTHNYAYFFHRAGNVWGREARIELGDTSVFTPFTSAFALSGSTVLIAWNTVVTPYVRAPDGTWSAQGVLDPLTSAPGFGASLALDGDRALVSSPEDTVYGWSGAGTVYVFERSNGAWTRTAHVAHTTVNYYSYLFGTSVALDGDTMQVTSPVAPTRRQAPRVTSRSLRGFGEDGLPAAVLDTGNDHRGERFGDAIAASGSTLLVGAPAAATSEPLIAGAAYIFDLADGNAIERACLLPSVPYGDDFGSALALDQDTAVVGVTGVAGNVDIREGAVYVYVRGDGGWPQQARLTDDGPGSDALAFGASVAVRGDVLAVGPGNATTLVQGRVHVVARSATAWQEQAVIEADDGSIDDRFGSAMTLVGTILAVGAPRAEAGIETDAGAVYVFVGSGGVWSQQAKITAPVSAELAGFGMSVALAGTTPVVGAVDAASSRGAAYVYTFSGGVWTLQDRLLPAGAIAGSYGTSVAISGSADRIVVGQPVGTPDDTNGRVFVFDHGVAGWSPSSMLTGATAPPNAYGDSFGKSVAMSGDTVAIGAPSDGRGGAAYLADIGESIFDNGFEGE